jgi:membrane protease YdiL (CAAX protease family)
VFSEVTGVDASRRTARGWLVIASPLLVVAIGAVAARVSSGLLADWAWIGTVPVYWLAMAATILILAGRQRPREWYKPSRGSRMWAVLAAFVALSAFPLLLFPNAGLLVRLPLLTALWIIFAVVNGSIEEAYWRGFLLTGITSWPCWLVALYSGVLFVIIHFVMLGAFAPVMFNVPFLLILICITAILTVLFLKTGSLRMGTAAHILNDIGNMNIFVFMGLTVLF